MNNNGNGGAYGGPDSMAYLEQISGGKKPAPAEKDDSLLKKLLNWKTAAIAAGIVIVFVVLGIILNLVSKPENEDYDLILESWYRSTYLIDTLDDYTEYLKSSDLRGMATSLRGVLTELVFNDTNVLMDDFGIEADDYEEDPRVLEEKSEISVYTATLEDARLNGVLDRTFVRETGMQIAYIISYQSECAARSEKPAVKEAALKTKANLENIKEQFDNFKAR